MIFKTFIFSWFLNLSLAWGATRVVTTIPDLAWLVKEIGKESVEVEALLSEKDNPHFVEAVPHFINKVVNSDLVALVGLELEEAWLPKIAERTGKKELQPGGVGYLEIGKSIAVLEKPTKPVDRSMGDVHAEGNPHFWLSPIHFSQAISPVVAALSVIQPKGAKKFEENGKRLKIALDENYQKNLQRVKSKLKTSVIEYHKEFTYFLNAFSFDNKGSLEEKPGFPPSLGHILQVSNLAKAQGVKLLLASLASPESDLKKFKELSGLPYLKFRTSLKVGESYFDFQNELITTILKVINELS